MLHTLADSPMLYLGTVAVLGLLVGSFLNVVIHRLPIMMERGWRAQCAELQGQPAPEAAPYSLVAPASACPHCGHKIRAWENIPLISYALLRGRCAGCGAAIAWRYPVVELCTGLLSLYVAWHFGYTWATAGALLLTWALVALCVIDVDHQLLPDSITLPLLWLGLGINLFGIYANLASAVIGAMVGYLVLWSVYWLFKLATGKEGMGYGDFKLLAALGAWLGWQMLPVTILLSSVVGAVVGLTLIVARGRDRSNPIPFGPYLAVAGWIALLWGADITQAYLHWSGVGRG